MSNKEYDYTPPPTTTINTIIMLAIIAALGAILIWLGIAGWLPL